MDDRVEDRVEDSVEDRVEDRVEDSVVAGEDSFASAHMGAYSDDWDVRSGTASLPLTIKSGTLLCRSARRLYRKLQQGHKKSARGTNCEVQNSTSTFPALPANKCIQPAAFLLVGVSVPLPHPAR